MPNNVRGSTFVITGGASLIGSHLADLLLDGGAAEVRLLDNFALGTPETIAHLTGNPRVKFLRGDILQLGDLLDASAGAQGLFAIAGFLTLPMSQNPALGVAVNAVGMTNTLDACRRSGVRRVVFSSSTAAYGNATTSELDEPTGFVSSGLSPASMVYSTSKLLGEGLCALYSQRWGLEYNVLRFASVYGERQHARAVNANFLAQVYEQIRAGKPPEIPDDGSEVHDYIYVTDVARALRNAFTSPTHGHTLNISTNVDTTLTELVQCMLKAAGRTDLQPVFREDKRLVKSYVAKKLRFSNARARDAIDWVPEVSVEEGVKRFIAWREQQDAAHKPA